MARIFTEGFEIEDSANFFNEYSTTPDGVKTTNGGTYGTGNYAFYLYHTHHAMKNISAISEFYIRTRYYLVTSHKLLAWRSGGTTLGYISYDGVSRHFSIYVGSTLVGTGVIEVFYPSKVCIEMHIKIDNSSGEISVKIDGVVDSGLAYTGDTQPSSETTVDNLYWFSDSISNGTYYLDDLALNDTSGGTDNSWCGDGYIKFLLPNANGDVSQLTGSDGNSVDNYLLVDDNPHDSDSTYVESDTVDQYDLYNLAASGLTGVQIYRVWVEARARDTIAAGGKIALGIKSGSTEDWSDDISILTSYTQPLKGDVYTVNPDDSAAWAISDIDALQVGVKVRN